MSNLKVIIVDDEASTRMLLFRYLQHIDIECETYQSAEELLAHLYPSAINESSYMPDLIIIDLELGSKKMQGIELIKELTHRNVPCELMAMSGVIPSQDYTSDIICFGAAVLLSKPLDKNNFLKRAKRTAEIGKKRRMKSLETFCSLGLNDQSRLFRPVFLSYANEDRQLANGIRRHIESYNIDVWYAPATVSLGCDFNEEIQKGIKDAFIFIPFISDNYLASEMCLNELNSFLNRVKKNSIRSLLFLPIVDNLSDRSRNSKLFKSITNKYHYNQLRPRVSDCLTSLIWRIQEHLENDKIFQSINRKQKWGR